mgnify:CR=1 FL=1
MRADCIELIEELKAAWAAVKLALIPVQLTKIEACKEVNPADIWLNVAEIPVQPEVTAIPIAVKAVVKVLEISTHPTVKLVCKVVNPVVIPVKAVLILSHPVVTAVWIAVKAVVKAVLRVVKPVVTVVFEVDTLAAPVE